MYKKLKGLEYRQADGQTNIKYISEGKTWKELHTFLFLLVAFKTAEGGHYQSQQL